MPLVMNCLDKSQTAVAGGNYFSFKAGEIKTIHNTDLASHIGRAQRGDGFVVLPDTWTDPETGEELEGREWTKTESGKKIVEEKKKEGISAYCDKLRQIVYNMQVSLKQDLDRANIKADPRVFASEGELRAFEELAKYQARDEDQAQLKVDRIKELERQIQGFKK